MFRIRCKKRATGLVGIIFDRVTTFSFINISEIRDKTYAFYEVHMVEVYSKSVCFLLQK